MVMAGRQFSDRYISISAHLEPLILTKFTRTFLKFVPQGQRSRSPARQQSAHVIWTCTYQKLGV